MRRYRSAVAWVGLIIGYVHSLAWSADGIYDMTPQLLSGTLGHTRASEPAHWAERFTLTGAPAVGRGAARDVGTPRFVAQADAQMDVQPVSTVATDTPIPDPWQFRISPLAVGALDISGTVTVRGIRRSIDVDLGNIVEHLDRTFGGRLEVQKGPWIGFLNVIYFRIRDDVTSPGPLSLTADVSVKSLSVEFGGAYRVASLSVSEWGILWIEPLIGGRYTSLKSRIETLQVLDVERTVDWIDPMIGMRLSLLDITKRFALVVRGDIGGFGLSSNQSELTWNLIAGLSYSWQWTPTFGTSLFAGYRVSDIDYKDSEGSLRTEFDARLTGPVVVLTLLF